MQTERSLKIKAIIFANRRYWSQPEVLDQAFSAILANLNSRGIENVSLCTAPDQVPQEPQDGVLLAVPISGAVQRWLLDTAAQYRQVLLLAAYVEGIFDARLTSQLLYANAAPTFAECWSQLRQHHPHARALITAGQLDKTLELYRAAKSVRNARIVSIGEMEPWVLSPSRDPHAYKQVGPDVVFLPQEELLSAYERTSEEAAKEIADRYWSNAQKVVEPSYDDMLQAGKLAAAIETVLKDNHADAAAIACFNLLDPAGTSSCIGVSDLNTANQTLIACEGDLDSALTMLMLKQVSDSNLWMANPAFHPDGSIFYSHCTAPTQTCQGCSLPYSLRNHHESGIGVSIQTELPVGRKVTIARYSSMNQALFVMLGESFEGAYKPVCRTQLNVRLEDPKFFLDNLLGCHQVIAFEDCKQEMVDLASILGIDVITN